jgi:hypothetical protein
MRSISATIDDNMAASNSTRSTTSNIRKEAAALHQTVAGTAWSLLAENRSTAIKHVIVFVIQVISFLRVPVHRMGRNGRQAGRQAGRQERNNMVVFADQRVRVWRL